MGWILRREKLIKGSTEDRENGVETQAFRILQMTCAGNFLSIGAFEKSTERRIPTTIHKFDAIGALLASLFSTVYCQDDRRRRINKVN